MLNISERRKMLALTQEDLAERLNVGQSTVAGWEAGKREPNIAKLIQMADIFGCTVDELIKKEDT